ncbi:hypothetical protein EVAR_31384_1 [Eumeta japonica]|uniref:Reverse transcriptase domain-containing protein n=1 Tax=Eumeta variegata TaxID=151549 RepID=A0A4C1XAC8_EUMVA|nr:hypothetical protein EVAR_31384_1 [Eumeta japonica]
MPLLYADDQVILAPSTCELQTMEIQMNDYVKKRGMKVNINKIKIMVFENVNSTTECYETRTNVKVCVFGYSICSLYSAVPVVGDNLPLATIVERMVGKRRVVRGTSFKKNISRTEAVEQSVKVALCLKSTASVLCAREILKCSSISLSSSSSLKYSSLLPPPGISKEFMPECSVVEDVRHPSRGTR